jgi:methionyl-tRNA formyltransferase
MRYPGSRFTSKRHQGLAGTDISSSLRIDEKLITLVQVPKPFFSTSSRHLLVTAAFGQLVPTRVLDHFLPMNSINIHPSLLPKYRGAAPIQWAIMNGEAKTGVTIQTLSRGKFDHGDILSQESSVRTSSKTKVIN